MRSYLKDGVTEKVRAAGGEIYAISSEPQVLADRAARGWHLGFETVGDPHHEISGACRERGWLDVFVNERLEFLRASAGATDWTPTHPKGYFQPGVLALDANGTPHISYYDNSFNRLKYAVYDTLSSTWDVQIVDESTSVGKFTSLALDASGHPFISYHDDLNGDLKVA